MHSFITYKIFSEYTKHCRTHCEGNMFSYLLGKKCEMCNCNALCLNPFSLKTKATLMIKKRNKKPHFQHHFHAIHSDNFKFTPSQQTHPHRIYAKTSDDKLISATNTTAYSLNYIGNKYIFEMNATFNICNFS